MANSTVTLGLIVATLVAFTGVDVWFSRSRVGSVEGLTGVRDSVRGRRTTATLVASVMGVWVLLSAPEADANFGIAAVAGYVVGEAVPMLVYACLDPRIRGLIPEGHSLVEYAHTRYGTAMYTFVLLMSALYMFIFLVAELTGITGVLSLVAGVPQWQTALLVDGFVLFYTSYDGLRASIATDAVQAIVIIPLLLLTFTGAPVALGGLVTVIDGITATNPALLSLGAIIGLQLGFAPALATLDTELISQTWWQRIYAADSSETVGRSFRTAALANGTIVFVITLFDVVVVGNAAIVTNPASAGHSANAAFFVFLGEAFPEWLALVAVLLTLLLVMNSTGTLLDMLSSLVTADLARLFAEPSDHHLTLGSRAFTAVIVTAVIHVSPRAQSVLRLFSFVDLLGAAVAFPLVYGLYLTRVTGLGALASNLTGLTVGLTFSPDFRGVIMPIPVVSGLPPAVDPPYLASSGGAFVVSTAASLVTARLVDVGLDLRRFPREIRRFDNGQTNAPSSD